MQMELLQLLTQMEMEFQIIKIQILIMILVQMLEKLVIQKAQQKQEKLAGTGYDAANGRVTGFATEGYTGTNTNVTTCRKH